MGLDIESIKTKNTFIGQELIYKDFLIFFGNKNSTLETIKSAYPELILRRIKQVHGDKAVLSSSDLGTIPEADGHYSTEKNIALTIITADCLPVFWMHPNAYFAGIHAGWRGVHQQIVEKSLNQIVPKGTTELTSVFIGPHIQKNSFEVDEDVKNQLLNFDLSPKDEEDFFTKKSIKYYIDLSAILKFRLEKNFQILSNNVYLSKIDTFSNDQFHSYRRDKEQSGRQLSFIAKIK
ncbi:MAG: polyphenol oxidase family protein [Pseudobdellovibrionaceae bacterium]